MDGSRRHNQRSFGRGQAEVLGVVLLLGITIVGTTAVLAVGTATLADSRDAADIERATRAMAQLDSQAGLVGHGGADHQQVSIGGAGTTSVDEDAGSMRVEVKTGAGDGDAADPVEIPLGAVVYEHGGTEIAYQGGGIWKRTNGGSTMVSPPEFRYRSETLTLPIISVRGEGHTTDGVSITPDMTQAVQGLDIDDPLQGSNVTITVTSRYHEAWGRFFADRTGATVETGGDDPGLGDDEVRVTIQTRAIHPELDGSIASVGGARMEFGSIESLDADSYDSSDGSYDEDDNSGEETRIQTRGELHVTSKGGGKTESIEIRGDLVASDLDVPPGQSGKLNVTGEGIEDSDLPRATPVAGGIDRRIDRFLEEGLSEGHDTPAAITIEEGNEENVTTDTHVTGDVALGHNSRLRIAPNEDVAVRVDGELESEGGEIEIDTTDTAVELYVDGEFALTEGAQLTVTGGGSVDLYVDDRVALEADAGITVEDDTRLDLYNTGTVEFDGTTSASVDGDVAKRFWLYSSGATIGFRGASTFTGALYAPKSEIGIEDDLTVYGTLVGDSIQFDDANVSMHYDTSLGDTRPFGGDEVPVVGYLHVPTHSILVET